MNESRYETLRRLYVKPIWGIDDVTLYAEATGTKGWSPSRAILKIGEWYKEEPQMAVKDGSLSVGRDRFLSHFFLTDAAHEIAILNASMKGDEEYVPASKLDIPGASVQEPEGVVVQPSYRR